jgi:hypothetical protein
MSMAVISLSMVRHTSAHAVLSVLATTDMCRLSHLTQFATTVKTPDSVEWDIRCPMLSVNPKMLPRLDELEADLLARQRAIDEGWRGETEGLDLTLRFLHSKRAQVTAPPGWAGWTWVCPPCPSNRSARSGPLADRLGALNLTSSLAGRAAGERALLR